MLLEDMLGERQENDLLPGLPGRAGLLLEAGVGGFSADTFIVSYSLTACTCLEQLSTYLPTCLSFSVELPATLLLCDFCHFLGLFLLQVIGLGGGCFLLGEGVLPP